ncbi:CFEM domain-containing protein [Stagonosporopsis vannaccii]|nr:CFEM domain-containing protein [Stagonosporopsis vannaccii]
MGVRPLVAVLLCLLTCFNIPVFGSQLDLRELTVADIPACGLRCLFLKLPPTGCAPTDFNCICASKTLEYELAACMLANCTMQDALDTSRVQADLCDLSDESKTQDVILYTSIVYSIAFLSVMLRVAGKAVSRRLAWDDAMVVAALLLTAIPLGCVLDMALKGFGEHLWNLGDGKLLPILRNLYISWSTYVIVLCMIKISLVLFYLEIFKTPRFRMTAYIFLVYLIINSLVIFFIAICACRPIPSFWNRDIKGKCIDIQAAAYANSASAIVQDILLLIIPLVFIRKLQMKRYRKIAVGFMFVIGTFGCIATIMRLPSLSTFKISIDPSWDYVPITIWTELELAAGFLCVSLPSIRMLFVKILPKRVMEFLSNITRPSRNRSNPTPNPHQKQQQHALEQHKWKKPSSWIDISANSASISDESTGKSLEPLTLGSGVRGSFMSAFWNRSTTQPSQFSQLRSGNHRRLESAMSNYSESGVAVTRPPYQEERKTSIAEQVEMVNVANRAHRHTNMSYGSGSDHDDHITALPQIGCIPEGSFSENNVSRHQATPAAQWSHYEKDMV